MRLSPHGTRSPELSLGAAATATRRCKATARGVLAAGGQVRPALLTMPTPSPAPLPPPSWQAGRTLSAASIRWRRAALCAMRCVTVRACASRAACSLPFSVSSPISCRAILPVSRRMRSTCSSKEPGSPWRMSSSDGGGGDVAASADGPAAAVATRRRRAAPELRWPQRGTRRRPSARASSRCRRRHRRGACRRCRRPRVAARIGGAEGRRRGGWALRCRVVRLA